MNDLSPEVHEHLKNYRVVTEASANISNPGSVAEHFSLTNHPLAEADLENWIEAADYATVNPNWWKGYAGKHKRKLLEHYASVILTGVAAGGTYMDAASAGSPFFKVLPRMTGAAKCYRQDLNFAAGISGDTIGSTGSAIPLPDSCLDGIVSHNAWEHFEGDAALGFIAEARRLLKPGAKLCIIPVSLAQRTEILTAPSIWSEKYKNAPDWPVFDRRATIVIKDEVRQRQVMRWAPAELAAALSEIPGMAFQIYHVTCGELRMFALVGCRT